MGERKLYKRICKGCGRIQWVRKELLGKMCRSCAMRIAKRHISEETRKKMSEARKGKEPWNKGKKLSKEYKKKLSEAHKGKPTWSTFHKEELRKRMKENNPMKNPEVLEKRKGENHHNWKGGITPQRIKWKNSLKGKKWRMAVFQRDNFTCQKCGQRGGRLNAHHIYNWSQNKELRECIENGITLCEKCHIEFHKKYGFNDNNLEQLVEFLNKK